jgi:UDP-glucose 4-epimerase
MKLFITGAGGFVGAAVARAAVASGHEVIATIRPDGDTHRLAAIADDIRLVEMDLRQGEHVAATMLQTRPDVLIHVAWAGVSNRHRNDRTQITDNIDAAYALLDAGAAAGVRKFVGLGSQGEYGALGGRISETRMPLPSSLYGAAKLAVLCLTRHLAARSGMSFAWLRLFSAYGPDDNPRWLIPVMIEHMLNRRRPQTTAGTQLWDYLYIDDIAGGILAVAEQPEANGVFNLGSGQPVAVRRIVESIRDRAAPGMELVFGELPYPPDQIWHMEADITRLTAATGWRPQVDLATGLDCTVAWHRRLQELRA